MRVDTEQLRPELATRIERFGKVAGSITKSQLIFAQVRIYDLDARLAESAVPVFVGR